MKPPLPDQAERLKTGHFLPDEPNVPMFVARQAYRSRRIRDAARLMPALGFALVMLPVLWVPTEPFGATARGLIYLFVIWAGLILMAAVIAKRLSDTKEEDAEPPLEADLSDRG